MFKKSLIAIAALLALVGVGGVVTRTLSNRSEV